MKLQTRRLFTKALGPVFLLAASCTAPGGPSAEPLVDPLTRTAAPPLHDAAIASVDAPVALENAPSALGEEAPPPVQAFCRPTRSAELLPARAIGKVEQEITATTTTKTVQQPIFVADLFNLFKGACGACHIEQGLGSFRVFKDKFFQIDSMKLLASVKSDNPAKFMPPPVAGGKPFSMRTAGDPIFDLVTRLEQWFGQGKPLPMDVFYVPVEMTSTTQTVVTKKEGYLLGDESAKLQTNMGNCVPDSAMFGTQKADMDALDTFFETSSTLPLDLKQTDLISMDAEVLARVGVIAYAPAYPLWSDNSGKMRVIRVPRGKTINFDKAKQSFEIPANTRFYKTFLKKVIDRNGSPTWRRIETRLIVTRPDKIATDGSASAQSLFGTYAWNDDETEATLVRDQRRDGTPFADRLITYVLDEPKFQKILDSKPTNLSYALEQENTGIIRRYAIPGLHRCVECHMGSPSADFSLGFTPLQIRRRSQDTEGNPNKTGVYEPVGADEENQLQRLISYGLIKGVSSESDIKGLEEPQGERKFRNPQELTAQAYLIGNCAHCHNPRGFPSVNAPELKEALNFLPSTKGGVFQFPLDRVSPLRRRGAKQDVPLPYITPSLRDFPAEPIAGLYVEKFKPCVENDVYCEKNKKAGDKQFIAAPWRSLIYRNVDTPYIYADDYAIFPHMPRHSTGFDCRAPRILGEWMVSIPAVHKAGVDGKKKEDVVIGETANNSTLDREAQPYVEVPPGPDFKQASDAATERLKEFKAGKRYSYCPDTSDIVDLAALNATTSLKLVPQDLNQYADKAKKILTMPIDGVPDKTHFVVSDLTSTPGDWSPRRSDWQNIVVTPKPDKRANVIDVPVMLQDIRLTKELEDFALTEVPFGFWQKKPECKFPGQMAVKDVPEALRPQWLSALSETPGTENALVYAISPGAAIFNNICINCHGPKADSRGVLADAISEMSGGDARVANFKDGLFGPLSAPGANALRVFSNVAAASGKGIVSPEDWAARYFVWMALGGTERLLPKSLLSIVGTTPVLGIRRNHFAAAASPNMLQVAQKLCSHSLLQFENKKLDLLAFSKGGHVGRLLWSDKTGLIEGNGDAEMWVRLCSMGNRPVVRVLRPVLNETGGVDDLQINPLSSLYFGDSYPDTAPVMDHRGELEMGLRPSNYIPFCVALPDDAKQSEAVKAWVQKSTSGVGSARIPPCPPKLFERDTEGKQKWQLGYAQNNVGEIVFPDAEKWATRGAMNAGLAVYSYLKALEVGKAAPKPPFNRCEDLK